MAHQGRIYPYSRRISLLVFLGFIFFGAGAFFAAQDGEGSSVIGIFLAFSFLSGCYFLTTLHSVRITEDGISSVYLFRQSALAWNEIDSASPKWWGSFLLHDRSGTTKVYVNYQVEGFTEVVLSIAQKLPNLWKMKEYDAFHNSPWGVFYFLLIALGLFYAGSRSLFMPNELIYGIPLMGFGAALGLLGLRIPLRLHFEGSILVVNYLGREKRIEINEIFEISIKEDKVDEAFIRAVEVQLKNGQKMRFSNFKEGMPALVNAFLKWMDQYGDKLHRI